MSEYRKKTAMTRPLSHWIKAITYEVCMYKMLLWLIHWWLDGVWCDSSFLVDALVLQCVQMLYNEKSVSTYRCVSEEEKLIRLLANKTTDKQFQGLYLITTTNCNLNCDYCFYRSDISESLLKRSNMNYTVKDKVRV